MLKKQFLFFFFIFFGYSFLYGQKLEPSLHFNLENGLGQNTATIINQDNAGRVWIGTSGSLHVYNGYELKTIDEIHDRVLNIETYDDYVFCFTPTGIYRIEINNLEVKTHFFSKAKYYYAKIESSYVIVSDGKEHFSIRYDLDLNIQDSIVNELVETPAPYYSFVFGDGLIISDKDGVHFTKDGNQLEILKSPSTSHVLLPNGRFLFANAIGLHEWTKENKLKTLLPISIEHVFQDSENNIWVSTVEQGVYKIPYLLLNNAYFEFKNGDGSPISTWNTINFKNTSFTLTSKGLRAHGNKSHESDQIEKLTKEHIVVSAISGEDFILFGSSQNGIFKIKNGQVKNLYYDKNKVTENTPFQFIKNELGYLSYTFSHFIQFDIQGNLLFTKKYNHTKWGYIMHITKTDSGYLASTTEGMRLYSKKLEEVKVIYSNKAKIFSMSCHFNGEYIVSSLDGGLFKLQGDSLKPIPFPSKNLLTVKEFQRKLWITSTKELFSFVDGKITKYNAKNGMPIKEFNQNGSMFSNNSIYFFGVGGFFKLTIPPKPTTLDNVSIIVNHKRDNSTPIEIEASNNVFQVKLEGVNNIDIENYALMYYSDSTWERITKSKTLSLPVKHGRNILRTKVIHLPTGKSKEEAIQIYRDFPFWKKPWFLVLVSLVIIGLFVGALSLYKFLKTKKLLKLEQKEKRVKEERLRISRELHDNIGARLTYIISSLEMETHKTQKTELNKINDFARETMGQLRETIWAVGNNEITLSELFKRYQDYVDQISNFCTEHITIKGSITHDFPLTPLQTINYYRAFQESLNNATKYAESNQINITLTELENKVEIIIEDNGKGFDQNKIPKSGGVLGMQRRIEEANGEFKIQSILNKGTKITMTIFKR